MQNKNNAVCSICGKEYYKCISCKDMMDLHPWKRYVDIPEHYKIYQIIHGYSTGIYTKEEAKNKFKNIDLSDFNILRDNIKKVISDITKEKDDTNEKSLKENVINNKTNNSSDNKFSSKQKTK